MEFSFLPTFIIIIIIIFCVFDLESVTVSFQEQGILIHGIVYVC